MNSVRVIIPSWSRLSPELESETGSKYAAFIQLGGKPLYHHIMDRYKVVGRKFSFKLVLSTDASSVDIADFPSLDIELILINHSTSIAMTVLAGLKDISVGDPVVVNMADTLVQLDKGLELDCVYTDSRIDLYRWTSVKLNLNRELEFPSERDTEETAISPQDVCTGIFSFSDGYRLKSCLESAISSSIPGSEPFFTAISNYSREVCMHLSTASVWLDCGHVDTYYESRLSHQNLRHFNTLIYDALRGQVKKTSLKVEQFRHQVRWYKQVPDSLAAFLPRIFDSSDGDHPYITMELLSIPTLSDAFVTKRLSPGAWNGVVKTIYYIRSEMDRLKYKTSLAHQLVRSVYLDKTRSRIEEFVNQDPLALKYKINIDSYELCIRTVLIELDHFVKSTGLLDIDSLSPIHGDFCFSNLLYDPKARLVKMIDPRGEFGIPGIYGDPRYDLAKLAHSFSGAYDFIMSDRFTMELKKDYKIDFEISMDDYHRKVKSIFENILISDFNLKKQILAIQALLFLSMLPLHSDKPKRQLAMLATGLRLFHRAKIEV